MLLECDSKGRIIISHDESSSAKSMLNGLEVIDLNGNIDHADAGPVKVSHIHNHNGAKWQSSWWSSSTSWPANGQQTKRRHQRRESEHWNPNKCRVEKDLYLDFEDYKHYTCGNCYK